MKQVLTKQYLLFAGLLALAACAQAPAPDAADPANFTPLTFGTSGYDYANSLAKHSSGVYAVGSTDGNLHGTQQGQGDAFVRKYDKGGSVSWGKQFGTPAYDAAEGVASDGRNNAYVVGTTYGSLAGSRGASDVFVRKYTSSGSVSWTKQFGTSGYDFVGDVATYGTNVVYVVGTTPGNLAGSKGNLDAFIRKYTASGGVAWTKQFGTSAEDLASDVAVDGSGNAYVVGYTYGSLSGSNGGGADIFIRKYNTNGSVGWTKQLNYSDADYGNAVAIYGSSVYLVGGFYYNNNSSDADVRVVKLTTSGAVKWDRGLGPVGSDYVNEVAADSSGVIFSGYTYTSFAGTHQGSGDGYVYKLDTSGSYRWAKQLGTSAFDAAQAVALRGSEVYVAGYTYGVLGSSSSGNADAFLRQLKSSSGSTVWTDQ